MASPRENVTGPTKEGPEEGEPQVPEPGPPSTEELWARSNAPAGDGGAAIPRRFDPHFHFVSVTFRGRAFEVLVEIHPRDPIASLCQKVAVAVVGDGPKTCTVEDEMGRFYVPCAPVASLVGKPILFRVFAR